MKILSLFGCSQDIQEYQLFIDGASRGNPGEAGVGIFLKNEDKVLLEKGFYIGKTTNNVAEYKALQIALQLIQNLQLDFSQIKLTVFSDSQLLVNQMTDVFKVKNSELKKIKLEITDALQLLGFNEIHFRHIYREKNTKADALANLGIDKRLRLEINCNDK